MGAVGARAIGGSSGVALTILIAGCGPWITTIPTYWEVPPRAPRPRLERSDEPVATLAIEPPAEPEPKPEPEVAAPVDDRPACTAIYVVSSGKRLYAFDPRERAFELRGELACPSSGRWSPFSMAVAQTGKAQVLYNDGRMYSVAVTDGVCEATAFAPHQSPGFSLFGMGYARQGEGETLFVAQIPFSGRSKGLARVDTSSGKLTHIDRFDQNPGSSIELTSTRNGLWGYFLNDSGVGGTLVEIDPDTAAIETAIPLPVGTGTSALAVAWWGGDFYIFTTFSGGTEVTRYDPKAEATDVVATIADTIVGAGVATCAPDRPSRR